HLRRRGDLPVPLGDGGAPAQDLRHRRDRHLHLHPAGRTPPRVAQGSAGMGVNDAAYPNVPILRAQGDAGAIPIPRVGERERTAAQSGVITTTISQVIQWGRYSSIWPALFGLACCAIEIPEPARGRTTRTTSEPNVRSATS